MAVVRIVDADAEERRQKRIMIALFSIGVLGLGYLVYDYLQIVNRVELPRDLNQVDLVVEKWKADGLVVSFDASAAKLVVDERHWDDRTKEEKLAIITQLARYCAEKNKSERWNLTVVGRTSIVLAGIGPSGLIMR